jgi:hypothetical protein
MQICLWNPGKAVAYTQANPSQVMNQPATKPSISFIVPAPKENGNRTKPTNNHELQA